MPKFKQGDRVQVCHRLWLGQKGTIKSEQSMFYLVEMDNEDMSSRASIRPDNLIYFEQGELSLIEEG